MNLPIIRGNLDYDIVCDDYYVKGKYITMTNSQYKRLCAQDPSILEETVKITEYLNVKFGVIKEIDNKESGDTSNDINP